MRRFLILIMVFILGAAFSGCVKTPSENLPENSEDKYNADKYDFGDSSNWAADNMKVVDLGDAIMEAYPYDDHYDWGQTIIYDAGVYKMWWVRQSPHDTIWYAESSDLKNWTNEQRVLKVEENSDWIKMHIGKPTVIKVDGKYKMYFEAPATLDPIDGYTETDNNVLMATSKNGIDWAYYTADTDEAQPVIRMTDEQLNNGYYGIGQPSVLYKDGMYYIYYTYAVGSGDKMYMSTSKDGINFSEGVKVFDRAGCGVKFNKKTNKFMLAYERTSGGVSHIYYMESTDGIKFTYESMVEASNNSERLSKDIKQVRGYADFIGNEHGIVDGYTVYAAYMEGDMAQAGDWRMYSNTWDIHFTAFNVKEFANRKMVLPNNKIIHDETLKLYEKKHVKYEIPLWQTIEKAAAKPEINAEVKNTYDGAKPLVLSRTAYLYGSVPTQTTAQIQIKYLNDGLLMFVTALDKTVKQGDSILLIIDETAGKNKPTEKVSYIEIFADTGEFTHKNGNGNEIDGLTLSYKRTANGYNAEIFMPFRFVTAEENTIIRFDAYIYDNALDKLSSVKGWNDYLMKSKNDLSRLGEIELI